MRTRRKYSLPGEAAALMLLALVPTVATAGPAAEPPGDHLFDRHEVVLGSAPRQTVLTGFLLGGPVSELAVLNIDDNHDRRLRIFVFGNGVWEPRVDVTLPSEVRFVDVANIGGHDRLITYEQSRPPAAISKGRLDWFDPESETRSELVTVTSSFESPRAGELPHVDATLDLNGDGRDDLVVPDQDGFWVFVQKDGGSFAEPVKLGPPADLRGILGADGYRYDPWSVSRIHEADINRDGRSDLAFWNEDHLEIHLQDEHGMFTTMAETLRIEVPFDSDDVFSLATRDMTGRVLHSLADINGDDTTDLVVFSLTGQRVSKKRSVYEVHFGQPTPDGGISFAKEVGAAFRTESRIQVGMDRPDLSRDGPVAIMFTTIERRFLESSLWKRIKGAMGDDVWLSLELHNTEDGLDRDRPNASYKIALDGVPSHREPGAVPLSIVLRGPTHESRRTQTEWPRAFNRTLLIGDVTGDGRSDLLIEPEFRELNVFVGVPGPDLFAPEPHTVAVILPHDEEYTWLVDLNKDGKQDILLHHPFTSRNPHGAPKLPPGAEPHRVVMLIAR